LIGECEDDQIRHQLLAVVIAKSDPSQISPSLDGVPFIEEADGLKRYQNYVIPSLKLVDAKVEPFVVPEFKRIANVDGAADAHIPIHVLAADPSSAILFPGSEEESTIQKFELPFAQDAFVCSCSLISDPFSCTVSHGM
jgi:hypothetical protein